MKKSIFINVSNHPSNRWSADQLKEAEKYGRVVDLPFPNVDPHADEGEIREMAAQVFANIMDIYTKGAGDCSWNGKTAHATECGSHTDISRFEADGAGSQHVANGTLTVMVQGEFTLTYALVGLLKEANADVVSACSARQVHEVQMKDGITKKMAEFKFIRFRHY